MESYTPLNNYLNSCVIKLQVPIIFLFQQEISSLDFSTSCENQKVGFDFGFNFFGYLKRDAVDVEMCHSWFLAFGHQKCPRIVVVIVCWASFIGNEEDPMILQHPHFLY